MAVHTVDFWQIFVSFYFIEATRNLRSCVYVHATVLEVLLPRFLILVSLTWMVSPLTWMVQEHLPFCWRRWITSEKNKIYEQIICTLKDPCHTIPLSHFSPFHFPTACLSFPLVVEFFLPLSSLISWDECRWKLSANMRVNTNTPVYVFFRSTFYCFKMENSYLINIVFVCEKREIESPGHFGYRKGA